MESVNYEGWPIMKSRKTIRKKEIPDDAWKLVKFRMMQTMPATARLAIDARTS